MSEIVQVVVTEGTPVSIGIDTVSGLIPSLCAYHHYQATSSTTWEIVHRLGFIPNVTTMDSGGSVIEGELQHVSKNHLRVTFSAPISGNAYLS